MKSRSCRRQFRWDDARLPEWRRSHERGQSSRRLRGFSHSGRHAVHCTRSSDGSRHRARFAVPGLRLDCQRKRIPDHVEVREKARAARQPGKPDWPRAKPRDLKHLESWPAKRLLLVRKLNVKRIPAMLRYKLRPTYTALHTASRAESSYARISSQFAIDLRRPEGVRRAPG